MRDVRGGQPQRLYLAQLAVHRLRGDELPQVVEGAVHALRPAALPLVGGRGVRRRRLLCNTVVGDVTVVVALSVNLQNTKYWQLLLLLNVKWDLSPSVVGFPIVIIHYLGHYIMLVVLLYGRLHFEGFQFTHFQLSYIIYFPVVLHRISSDLT